MLEGTGVPLLDAGSMEEAVRVAAARAQQTVATFHHFRFAYVDQLQPTDHGRAILRAGQRRSGNRAVARNCDATVLRNGDRTTIADDQQPAARLQHAVGVDFQCAGARVGFAAVTRLRTLGVRTNALTDIGDLATLTDLRSLDLRDNPGLVSLAPLKSLVALDFLGAGGHALAQDLAPLTGLPLLRQLILTDIGAADYTPLGSLPALRILDLGGATLDDADLPALGALVGLTELSLRGTAITDLGPLSPLVALVSLDAGDTTVTSVAPVAAWTDIEELDLAGTRIPDLAGFNLLKHLRGVDISDTGVSSLAPLVANEYFRRGDHVNASGAALGAEDCAAILALRAREAIVDTEVACE